VEKGMADMESLVAAKIGHLAWSYDANPSPAESPGSLVPAGLGPEVEDQRRILRERARLLAREPQADNAEEVLVVVEFILAHERYGLESTLIREVYPLKEFTPLPGTPSFILGIMNLRGQILSITDIRKFFDLPEKRLTNLNRVIILKNHDREFGILADDIVGMRTIALKDLQLSLPTLTGLRADYLKGVTPDRLVVLEGEKLLTDDRLLVHAEVE
jgi:purine-binding chemotaxis protein CheW